ncbi:hypothetical protein GOP47_0020965 [Adiantum capillus-veneris]|uniref:Uncharacterized protein n=1 Tax=Adiantum capillus-veneris TaxID=13818 RepID=A0A9D4UAE8_ADICA|nr:hypothetical protein GOP47_0020965 [Adiantum capillus-veneris]
MQLLLLPETEKYDETLTVQEMDSQSPSSYSQASQDCSFPISPFGGSPFGFRPFHPPIRPATQHIAKRSPFPSPPQADTTTITMEGDTSKGINGDEVSESHASALGDSNNIDQQDSESPSQAQAIEDAGEGASSAAKERVLGPARDQRQRKDKKIEDSLVDMANTAKIMAAQQKESEAARKVEQAEKLKLLASLNNAFAGFLDAMEDELVVLACFFALIIGAIAALELVEYDDAGMVDYMYQVHVLTCFICRVIPARAAHTGRRRHENRACWAYPWPHTFMEQCLSGSYSDKMFKSRLRVSRDTFNFLTAWLAPKMRRSDTNCRKAITVEKRVCVALHRLASGASLQIIADMYSISIAAAQEIVIQFCDAVSSSGLHDLFVKWPSTDRMQSLAKDFEAIHDSFDEGWIREAQGELQRAQAQLDATSLDTTVRSGLNDALAEVSCLMDSDSSQAVERAQNGGDVSSDVVVSGAHRRDNIARVMFKERERRNAVAVFGDNDSADESFESESSSTNPCTAVLQGAGHSRAVCNHPKSIASQQMLRYFFKSVGTPQIFVVLNIAMLCNSSILHSKLRPLLVILLANISLNWATEDKDPIRFTKMNASFATSFAADSVQAPSCDIDTSGSLGLLDSCTTRKARA